MKSSVFKNTNGSYDWKQYVDIDNCLNQCLDKQLRYANTRKTCNFYKYSENVVKCALFMEINDNVN